MSTLAGVLGFPVEHSRSPAMMNAAFAALDLDWRYVRLPAPPARFAEIATALGRSGYRGANVTIPHKLAARDIATELTGAASAIGAVNTLTFRPDGAIEGHNTDAPGLLAALGSEPPGTALVLGAGGAGRAAAWALSHAGWRVSVWNRTPERARALAREMDVDAAEEPPARAVDLVVNATAAGLRRGDGDELPLPEASMLVELVYGSGPTRLAARAAGRGMRVVDGLEVLVRQGALSLEIWTGREPPLDAMRRAAFASTSSTSTQA